MTIYITLGPNCHAAGNLKHLNYRNQSLPFDWLMTEKDLGIKYVNENIKNNFSLFTENLKSKKGKVFSTNYPESIFFHHNLIKEPEYVVSFKRRGERFMNLISDNNNEIVFLYFYDFKSYLNKKGFDVLFNSIKEFENNSKIKAKYKLIIYLVNNDTDFQFDLYPEISQLSCTYFFKYIRNTKVSKIYGDKKDFQNMLDKISLLPFTRKEKEPKFVIKPSGCLCQRIKIVLSYLFEMRQRRRGLMVLWENSNNCNGFFLDYFERIKDINFVNKTNKKIDYEGSETNKSFNKKDYIEMLKELKPNLKIQKEVNKFINRNLLPEYNAVYITLLPTSNVQRCKTESEKSEHKILENFILSNNNIKVFLTPFLLENINLPNVISYSNNKNSLEKEIIDLFLCVRAKKFQGSIGSSSTEIIQILRGT